jgi:activator of HSP90 ATPase
LNIFCGNVSIPWLWKSGNGNLVTEIWLQNPQTVQTPGGDMLTTDTWAMPGLSSTRRQWMMGATAAIGGLAVGSSNAWAAADDGLSRTAEAIHQEPVFKASPKHIYDALTDAEQFQKVELIGRAMKSSDLAAKPAEISREPGGSFTIFGAYIVGRQIELVANQRIVQAWREISWDPGVYSLVKFVLTEQGSGTKLIFDHTGFPSGNGEHLAAGWKSHYWEALDKFLS